MTIENKPAERLIKAFAEGRFDPSVEEIFSTSIPVKAIETPHQFHMRMLQHYNSCLEAVESCPVCQGAEQMICNCGCSLTRHLYSGACGQCACNHFGQDGEGE